ncbi:hypothetical protein B6U80_00385 [Candidatus Pacearchaeota archaeon ex4484_26]|nr:MAG: hypothetical protein B6U80_00385 [Candidatus Pacearchaeota archaeon ex4484_26]
METKVKNIFDIGQMSDEEVEEELRRLETSVKNMGQEDQRKLNEKIYNFMEDSLICEITGTNYANPSVTDNQRIKLAAYFTYKQ